MGNYEIGPATAQEPLETVTQEVGHRFDRFLVRGGIKIEVSEPISGSNFWWKLKKLSPLGSLNREFLIIRIGYPPERKISRNK